jgi:sialidase-1
MKKILIISIVLLFITSCFKELKFGEGWVAPDQTDNPTEEKPVYPDDGTKVSSIPFEAGLDNHVYFRIPALVETKAGTLLAFCEARNTRVAFYSEAKFPGITTFQPGDSNDLGDIDLVVKRSTDGGATWEDMITIQDDNNNTCGNPSPVIDQSTGRIWLFWCWHKAGSSSQLFPTISDGHTRRVLYSTSDDDGKTWSNPVDMTSTLKDNAWQWYATGPGHAIQKVSAPHKGRIMIPCNHRIASTNVNHSHCVYSDDHGVTWTLGGSTEAGGNESILVEKKDGSIMTSMRIAPNDRPAGENTACRAFSTSTDGGVTWGTFDIVESLKDPGCQGSIVNYLEKGKPSDIMLLSNCHASSRKNMTISVSKDGGASWVSNYLVNSGRTAYSDIIVLSDGSVCLLYEAGCGKYTNTSPYERIYFLRIPASIVKTELGL